MADDYGDDSGQKILDDLTRFAERMGAAAMIRRADGLHAALEHAKSTTAQEKTRGGAAPVEYAKLDMYEFRALDDYDGIKEIIEAKLRAHGVNTAWFADEQLDKEYLLFHVSDAKEARKASEALESERGHTRVRERPAPDREKGTR